MRVVVVRVGAVEDSNSVVVSVECSLFSHRVVPLSIIVPGGGEESTVARDSDRKVSGVL